MAIYHLSVKPISRGKGRLAVACAAYRSGKALWDVREERWHDYTGRRDRMETFIAAPKGAPAWASDREELWNQVEASERRKDARVAREIQVALPKELTEEQQRELVEAFVRERFVSQGMVADVAIHRGDHQNPHVHIMLTTRPLEGERFASKKPDKQPGWADTPRDVHRLRESWELHANRQLERAGSKERVSCRSYKRRGIDKMPTIHEGPDARDMEKRGIRTKVGDRNREARRRNEARDRQLRREQRSPDRSDGRDGGLDINRDFF